VLLGRAGVSAIAIGFGIGLYHVMYGQDRLIISWMGSVLGSVKMGRGGNIYKKTK
jgi:hypothetical protein